MVTTCHWIFCRLLDDRAYNHKVRFDSRRRLEDDWMKATEIKRARDLEDRLIGLESGMLLHEQCDQYNHCKQCKRRLNNCGESNIWSESRYVPGSRIMVWFLLQTAYVGQCRCFGIAGVFDFNLGEDIFHRCITTAVKTMTRV